IADDTFAYLMDYVKPGMTESEIAVELEFFMKKQGAESVSFDPIVALGANSALPHATPGDREVREGDILLIDMGAKYRGYCSDMTRTVFIGEPTDKMQEVYEIVLEAQEVGLAALGPGESTKEVDGKARDVIEEHGYGDKYGHGLGHGVGLEIHEKPRLAQTEDNVLEEGMVVTVEPGIYLPGWGGVRIEDMVYITEKGYEFFSRSPKREVFNPLG
ncbi:aminopeptidase P family protein, partial [Candidatus Bipolaricaulota bacterium]|nr:aminopeptidase P family protein [Candidatus Bipolaricaulota bacterium]